MTTAKDNMCVTTEVTITIEGGTNNNSTVHNKYSLRAILIYNFRMHLQLKYKLVKI